MTTLLSSEVQQPTGVAEPWEPELGLITNARRRQRRRRVAGLATVAMAGLFGLIAAVNHGGPRQAPHGGDESQLAGAVSRSPAAVFVQAPYMGVACHVPNRISCDRVGLAVWLRAPAAVTATIAGARLTLDNPTWSYVARPGHLYVYAGFLQPAGLTTRLGVRPESANSWRGVDAPSPLVRFRIDYGRGDVVSTQEHVYLSAGWG